MFRDKMKVIGAIALALSLTVGFLAPGAANVVYAADQSSRPSSQPQLIGGVVPGWCNWDGDQDKDDCCWSTTGNTAYGYSAPAGTVVPYGTVIGQTDPAADGYPSASYYNNYMGNYNYNYNYNYGYNYNYLYPRRLYLNRDPDDRMFRRYRGVTVPYVVPWWMRP